MIYGVSMGVERPGAKFLNAVLSAHSQVGLPIFGMYGVRSFFE